MRRGMWMMLCACAVAWSLAGNTRAQDALLNDLYGLGVHAYYSNDYFRAHELLTSAVEQGSQDPRVFYFRGLTYQMLGRPDEARDDFRQGAQLELTTISPVPMQATNALLSSGVTATCSGVRSLPNETAPTNSRVLLLTTRNISSAKLAV